MRVSGLFRTPLVCAGCVSVLYCMDVALEREFVGRAFCCLYSPIHFLAHTKKLTSLSLHNVWDNHISIFYGMRNTAEPLAQSFLLGCAFLVGVIPLYQSQCDNLANYWSRKRSWWSHHRIRHGGERHRKPSLCFLLHEYKYSTFHLTKISLFNIPLAPCYWE